MADCDEKYGRWTGKTLASLNSSLADCDSIKFKITKDDRICLNSSLADCDKIESFSSGKPGGQV